MLRLVECTLVFILTVTAHAQTGGDSTPFPAGVSASPATASGNVEAAALPRCNVKVALAMFTDDPYNTADEIAVQWRTLGLPQPHALARKQAEAGGCFDLFSPDPLLLALPGAPLPDVIVRIRPARLVTHEQTVSDKVDAGIRGYIESYTTWLGAKSTTEGPPLLREAGVKMSVLCPRSRRVVREIDSADTQANKALVQQGENTATRQNAARVERALAQAFAGMLALVRTRPCDITAAPSSSVSQSVTPDAVSRNEALPLKSAIELPPVAATPGVTMQAAPRTTR